MPSSLTSCVGVVALALLPAWVGGCDDSATPEPTPGVEDGGTSNAGTHDAMALSPPPPSSDTMRDAGGGGTSPGPGNGGQGGGVPSLALEPVCYLHVAATCDGDEDCPDDQVCCGDFDARNLSYTRIGCSDSCLPEVTQDRYRLCHPGDECAVPGQVCRRSQVLPYPELAVCAAPAAVSDEMTGMSIPGEVLCGGARCGAGRACCLRAQFDPVAPPSSATQVLEPYCIDAHESCDCDGVAEPDRDAG